MSTSIQTVRLQQARDFEFDADFGHGLPALRVDEPPPLGRGSGPTPVQLFAASVGNCLSASLLFALRKFKQAPEPIACEVEAEVGRNAEGRLRVLAMRVQLRLGVAAEGLEHLPRVLDTFEAYCTVTQSIAGAIPVSVSVRDAAGKTLK